MNNEVSTGSAHSDQSTARVQPEAKLSQHLNNWMENQKEIDWPNDPEAFQGPVITPAALPTPPTTTGDDIPAAAEAGIHVRSVTLGDSAGPAEAGVGIGSLKRKPDDDEVGSSPHRSASLEQRKRQRTAQVLMQNRIIDIGSITEMNLHYHIEVFAQTYDIHNALQGVLEFRDCLLDYYVCCIRYGWSFPLFGRLDMLLDGFIDWLRVIAHGERCPSLACL